MTRYHLKNDATPGRCIARTPEDCRASPYTLDFHGTLKEVQAESERRLSAAHGEFAPAVSKQTSEASVVVEDRRAFSTDMSDSTEYRVEGGRVKAVFEGDDYDLGELRAIPEEEFKSWNRSSFGGEVNFQDGELYPIYNGDGEEDGVMARFGDSYYRTGTTTDYYDAFHTSASNRPDSEDSAPTDLGSRAHYESELERVEELAKKFRRTISRREFELGRAEDHVNKFRAEQLAAVHHGGGSVSMAGSNIIVEDTLDGYRHAYGPQGENNEFHYLGKLDPRLETTVETAAERKELTGDKPASFLNRLSGSSESYGRATVILRGNNKVTFATDANGYPVEKAVWNDIDSSKLPRELFEDEGLRKSIADGGVLKD